ncbi:MAG: hypothetical protein OXC79_13025, partial [Candidatus Poribacteria bacterium]|nr:hypothetical protein [Candidatus Poribacteria bacterium]
MIFLRALCVNGLSPSHQRKADFQVIRTTKLWGILGALIICTALLQAPASAQLMTPEEVLGF